MNLRSKIRSAVKEEIGSNVSKPKVNRLVNRIMKDMLNSGSYVFAVKSLYSKHVYIDFSSNPDNITRLLHKTQGGVEIVFKILVDDFEFLTNAIHSEFKEYETVDEWYDFSDDESILIDFVKKKRQECRRVFTNHDHDLELMPKIKREFFLIYNKDRDQDVRVIAEQNGFGRNSVYRWLRQEGLKNRNK